MVLFIKAAGMGTVEKGIQEIHLSIWWGLSVTAIAGTAFALLLSAFSAEGGHRNWKAVNVSVWSGMILRLQWIGSWEECT